MASGSNLDLSGFYGPPTDFKELGELAQILQQNKARKDEMDYRKRKEEEANELKKLDLIREFTDLSKHQTSSDVANAVGNKKAAEILQKYTAAEKTMSMAELQSNLSQETSGLIGGMDAMKSELDLSDATLKLLKQQYTGLDINELSKYIRKDILKRRMDENFNFVNPITVPPTSIDLSNPETLADYITDDSGIIKAITNPQGGEPETVLMGKQGDYTKFEGKVNYWKKPNYDRKGFNEEGFYTGKDIPSLVTKGSTLPSDALPSSNGKPFNVIDKEVFTQFTSDDNQKIGLLAATKRKFPGYGTFNQQEKEYAQRNTMYNMVETLDPSQLHPTSNVRPPRTTVNVGSKPTKSEILANTPLNLTEYKKVGDEYDITDLAPGIKVTGYPTGETLAAKEILFNPNTKRVTYTDQQGNKKTQDFGTFRQNIATINTGVDLSFIDRLKVTNAPSKTDTPKPTGGYTQITETNKGTIGVKDRKWYYTKTGKPVE